MKQPVRFLKGYRKYMRGEIAGFAKEQSDDLIRRGIAVAVDPSGELIAYQPPAESQRERAPALEVWPPATEQRGTGEDALAGTVADACERLLTIEDPGQLERMQRAERAGRQRADVLQAVAGRMSGSWPPPPGEAPQESRLSDDDLRRLYAERMLRDLGDPYAFQMTVRRFNGQSPIHIPGDGRHHARPAPAGRRAEVRADRDHRGGDHEGVAHGRGPPRGARQRAARDADRRPDGGLRRRPHRRRDPGERAAARADATGAAAATLARQPPRQGLPQWRAAVHAQRPSRGS